MTFNERLGLGILTMVSLSATIDITAALAHEGVEGSRDGGSVAEAIPILLFAFVGLIIFVHMVHNRRRK